MANESGRLMDGTGWLLAPLCTKDVWGDEMSADPAAETLPAFIDVVEERVQSCGEETDSEIHPSRPQAAE